MKPSAALLLIPLRALCTSESLRFPRFLLPVFCSLLAVLPAHAQSRPPITGIASVRLYSSDLQASSVFYGQLLGLPDGHNCQGPSHPCFSVNGRQHIELQQITGATPDNLLAQVAFSTPDLSRMREFLLAHKIAAGPIAKDASGASYFTLRDPEDHPLAFVQQTSASGSFVATKRQISARILHAGFIVKDLAAEKAFYQDLLGFRLYWQGGFQDNGVDWYEIQVPDGEEWIEFMLNIPANADRRERGVQNHISLGVPDANAAAALLRSRGAGKFDGPEVGRDGKNSLDIYDPDLSRVEIMDFKPSQTPCCHAYSADHPKP